MGTLQILGTGQRPGEPAVKWKRLCVLELGWADWKSEGWGVSQCQRHMHTCMHRTHMYPPHACTRMHLHTHYTHRYANIHKHTMHMCTHTLFTCTHLTDVCMLYTHLCTRSRIQSHPLVSDGDQTLREPFSSSCNSVQCVHATCTLLPVHSK